jgi:molecular chaperone IbpA
MRTIDLSPFRRSSVGFDRMLELLDDNFSFENTDYPPYNITRTGENNYRISLAVPGYKANQLNIVAHQNVLTVVAKADEQDDQAYVHRGIKGGTFERRFNLADYVQVKNASMADGMLQIDLEREVPEELKPRRIEINAAAQVQNDNVTTIEQKRAS